MAAVGGSGRIGGMVELSCASQSDFTRTVIAHCVAHRVKTCNRINHVMHDLVDVPTGYALIITRVEGPCYSFNCDFYDHLKNKDGYRINGHGLRIHIEEIHDNLR